MAEAKIQVNLDKAPETTKPLEALIKVTLQTKVGDLRLEH